MPIEGHCVLSIGFATEKNHIRPSAPRPEWPDNAPCWVHPASCGSAARRSALMITHS
jgi:hypothetical protein